MVTTIYERDRIEAMEAMLSVSSIWRKAQVLGYPMR